VRDFKKALGNIANEGSQSLREIFGGCHSYSFFDRSTPQVRHHAWHGRLGVFPFWLVTLSISCGVNRHVQRFDFAGYRQREAG
jgi:hypothetical protein